MFAVIAPEWVVGRFWACFVESQKSESRGSNPRRGQLKLDADGTMKKGCESKLQNPYPSHDDG
eukprot:4075574-Ditylum_brightwellii.AAC.2